MDAMDTQPELTSPTSPAPGTPLQALSPERLNNMRSPSMTGRSSLPASPSEAFPKLGSPPKLQHSRNSSDIRVRGMVARFDQLDSRDKELVHRRDEQALRRAEMARETAELESRRLREGKEEMERNAHRIRDESRKLRAELDEGRERERKVCKRLEVVMEELHRAKETHSHAQSLYEKEIRKARKEAFRSSSALVKMQEELKATRNSLRITQSGFESEKIKCTKREQEAFAAQYQLVDVQEELQKSKEQTRVVEQERDALKTSLKEEEVARIAAEGRIALPASNPGEEDEFDSPKKSRTAEGSDKESSVPSAKNADLKTLNEELHTERRRRERAEDTVEFMKMECQFQCCSCRVAELNGDNYIHDDTFEKEMAKIRTVLPALPVLPVLPVSMTPPISEGGDADIEAVSKRSAPFSIERPATPPQSAKLTEEQRELLFSPNTGTFRSVPSPNKAAVEETQPDNDTVMAEADAPVAPTPSQPASLPSPAPEDNTSMDVDEPPTTTTTNRPPSPPHTPSTEHRGRSATSHGYHHRYQQADATPAARNLRTITTTTTVPMHFDSPKPVHHFHTISRSTFARAGLPNFGSEYQQQPETPTASAAAGPNRAGSALKDRPFDRDAALEQIQARRRRARSVADGQATPRRAMVEGVGVRRDVSAPM